ncbi:hypothetical protein E2542_SST16865 [Spatholobus suberectus]|nr:hypothetical protein E2542_SST16865 [Spatholobus suberectus]
MIAPLFMASLQIATPSCRRHRSATATVQNHTPIFDRRRCYVEVPSPRRQNMDLQQSQTTVRTSIHMACSSCVLVGVPILPLAVAALSFVDGRMSLCRGLPPFRLLSLNSGLGPLVFFSLFFSDWFC